MTFDEAKVVEEESAVCDSFTCKVCDSTRSVWNPSVRIDEFYVPFFSHLCKVHYFLHRYIRHMLLFTNYMFGMYIYPRVDEHRCEKHGFHDLPMEYDYSSIASCTVYMYI